MSEDFYISTDNAKLDTKVIQDFLNNRSYWGKGRSLETIKTTIDNSLCFGVYDNKNNLIGFARVVTDYAIFAYLMDVFILEDYRGAGLGKRLLQHILEYPGLKSVLTWKLETKDAHGLYKKFGFTEAKFPATIMEKKAAA